MAFNQLLVPIAPEQDLNDSHHQAFQFANQCGAKVTLQLVIKELAEYKDIFHLSGSTLDVLDHATKHYHDALNQHIHNLNSQYPNIQFTSKVDVGVPFIEIIKEASHLGASMVIIDSYRQSKKEACERGSNTLNLMRKSETPIWSLGKVSAPVKQVVAAIDLTNSDYYEFNTKLVEMAVEFCTRMKATLTLCHVWQLESEGFLRDWSGYSDIEIALLAKKLREERLTRLNDLLAPYTDSDAEIHTALLEGETREVFPQYVTDNKMDLVVMGSMSRSGISGFVLGNTAEDMLNKLDCSVITLKPDSFKSPVQP
ncbi:universal stress protein [Vibrio brasiliensis]|jgi:nucleotide-binding universal stress UspA family protein|uniref:universal stress protein n=1 Tax=Vibrio brasiliensis TaxID=170652 RepID=UPI001EFD2E88|nr:universal stress protein [Vibrio brasiliensis]MCG9752187.1 universal stress protein [Vibrio brasiliensis]